MAGAELGLDAPLLPGRPRPHYTYSRKSSLKRSQDQQADMDYTDDDDDDDEDSNPQPVRLEGLWPETLSLIFQLDLVTLDKLW